MQVNDSRKTWREYWASRPLGARVATAAILAGLLAIYAVMGTLAIVGVWRNNLFRLDTNWPWAFPLAALSLVGRKFRKPVLVHAVVFGPLLAMQALMVFAYGMSGHMTDVWPAPVSILGIAVANVLAFRWLSTSVQAEGEASANAVAKA